MKIFKKLLYLCVLLSFIISLLTGCENKQEESLISSSGAEMQSESETLQPTDTGIVISSVVMKRKELCKRITMPYSPQTDRCSNYYSGAPDFPVDGQTAFTYLAQSIISTSTEDEVMYFLVYINYSKYSVDLSIIVDSVNWWYFKFNIPSDISRFSEPEAIKAATAGTAA